MKKVYGIKVIVLCGTVFGLVGAIEAGKTPQKNINKAKAMPLLGAGIKKHTLTLGVQQSTAVPNIGGYPVRPGSGLAHILLKQLKPSILRK